MSREELSAGLAEKVSEFRILSAPLGQAIQELEYAQSLLRSRYDHDIAQHVPALGALAEILGISSLDLLMSNNRVGFLEEAMAKQGLTAEEVGAQMKSLIESPESREELKSLGLGEQISQ